MGGAHGVVLQWLKLNEQKKVRTMRCGEFYEG